MLRMRLAPTPSGFIHLGNALNFALVERLARSRGAELGLRIDDFDPERVRDEYVEDVFRALAWLGIRPDAGPRDLADFRARFSFQLHQPRYRSALAGIDRARLYACECSRTTPGAIDREGAYTGICRDKRISFQPGVHALRFRTGEGSWTRTLRDFVVWTKHDRAAYQLASVVEDAERDVTFIVRGVDLGDSSLAQLELAHAMGGTFFGWASRVRFFHHRLIEADDRPGVKLSKTHADLALREMIQRGFTRGDFAKKLEAFLASLGPIPE